MTPAATLSLAATAPMTLGGQFGEMVWLLSQSPLHRHLFLSDLEWVLMPPMLLGQHRLWRTPAQMPAGFAVWAFLSEDVARRMETGAASRLRPDEWRSGDKPWLLDIVAPSGGSNEMLAELKRTVFAGRSIAYRRVGLDGRRHAVETE